MAAPQNWSGIEARLAEAWIQSLACGAALAFKCGWSRGSREPALQP